MQANIFKCFEQLKKLTKKGLEHNKIETQVDTQGCQTTSQAIMSTMSSRGSKAAAHAHRRQEKKNGDFPRVARQPRADFSITTSLNGRGNGRILPAFIASSVRSSLLRCCVGLFTLSSFRFHMQH